MTYSDIIKINNELLSDDQLRYVTLLMELYGENKVELYNKNYYLTLYVKNSSNYTSIGIDFYPHHRYNENIRVGVFVTGFENKWVFNYANDVEIVKKAIDTIMILFDDKELGSYRIDY